MSKKQTVAGRPRSIQRKSCANIVLLSVIDDHCGVPDVLVQLVDALPHLLLLDLVVQRGRGSLLHVHAHRRHVHGRVLPPLLRRRRSRHRRRLRGRSGELELAELVFELLVDARLQVRVEVVVDQGGVHPGVVGVLEALQC